MKKYISILCIFLLVGVTGKTQEAYNYANTALTFLSVPVDARLGGMGEVGVAVGGDYSANLSNASKYAFIKREYRGGGSVFYMPWLRHLVNDMSVSGISGFYLLGEGQAVSTSFRYFSLGVLNRTGEDQENLGSSSPYEMAFDVAYSRRLSENFSMSVSLRYAFSDVLTGEYGKANVVAFDLGGYYRKVLRRTACVNTWAVGFGLTNVGGKVKYGSNQEFFLPAELKSGFSWTLEPEFGHRVLLSGELVKLLVASGEDNLQKSVLANFGASFRESGGLKKMTGKIGGEYEYKDILSGRVGYFHEGRERGRRRYITFGAGIVLFRIHLNGAYQVPLGSYGATGNTFKLSAGVVFQK